MNERTARDKGHFRFGVISPVLSADDARSLKERFAEQAAKVWTLPNGQLRQLSAATVEDWYYDFRKGGMDALINPPRRDSGSHRLITDEMDHEIGAILAANPNLKSSNVIRLLDEREVRKDNTPSNATLFRYLRKIRPGHQKVGKQRLAFEAPYAGNLYQTDIMYGPDVKIKLANGRMSNKQTYLLAILDDHSRLICHGEFFLTQDIMIYLSVLEKSIRKRGIPDKIYCDNGKVFLSSQITRIGAEIGTRIVHTKVRDAAAKGKIERFFRTVRDQFLELAEVDKVNTLSALNTRFFSWVEAYNHRRHSSLGCSPMEKWLRSPHTPRLLKEGHKTDDLFLLEVTRLVKKDGTFSLHGKRFETNYVHAGKKVTVHYDKNDLSRIHVYLEGAYVGPARPCEPGDNNNLPRQGAN